MEFTKIKHDVNGNPRYVVHFLACTPASWEHLEIIPKYSAVCKLMNTIGGRKYHNKQYGGGIVFQSYCLQELESAINKLKAETTAKEEYQGWTNSATWSAAYLTENERPIYEHLSAIRKAGKRVHPEDVYNQFYKYNLQLDSWTKGVVNWQEIADTHYNEQEFN